MAININSLGVSGEQIRAWLERQAPYQEDFYGNLPHEHFYPWGGRACSLVLPESITMDERTSVQFAGTFADHNDEETVLSFSAVDGGVFTCACGEWEKKSFIISTTLSEAIGGILSAGKAEKTVF